MNDVVAARLAAAPERTIVPTTTTGVFMSRVCKVTGFSSNGTPIFTTTLKLNIILDAYRLLAPLFDPSGQTLLPYQILSLAMLRGGSTQDNIILDISNVLATSCVSSFASGATGTFFHSSYSIALEKRLVYRITRYTNVFIKNNVLAVECEVDDMSGSPTAFVTPSIAVSRLMGQSIGTVFTDVILACKDPLMTTTMSVANVRN
jgi:hypothetical protein